MRVWNEFFMGYPAIRPFVLSLVIVLRQRWLGRHSTKGLLTSYGCPCPLQTTLLLLGGVWTVLERKWEDCSVHMLIQELKGLFNNKNPNWQEYSKHSVITIMVPGTAIIRLLLNVSPPLTLCFLTNSKSSTKSMGKSLSLYKSPLGYAPEDVWWVYGMYRYISVLYRKHI